MRIMIASFMLMAMLVGTSEAQTAAPIIKIGSWNIENLGERKHGQSPPALAEHIALAGVDILALQEIHDTDGSDSTRTNSKLDGVVKILKDQYGQNWKYTLFPNRNPKATARLCGVAWNADRVTREGASFPIPVVDNDPKDGFELWDRAPQATKFSAGKGKTDIVVVSLHMKSNTDGALRGQQQRKLEAEALAGLLANVRKHFSDEDLILLGDMNTINGQEDCLSVLAAADLVDLNADDVVTYRKGKFENPFDRILIPKDQQEFRFTRQYVLSPADGDRHLGSLSDHILVMAGVHVMNDDD